MSAVGAPAGAATRVPTAGPGASRVESRAVGAVLACIARYGIAKTTLDDVAREAGCARATLYRYFGGKQQLLGAAVAAEAARVGAELRAIGAGAPTLEDAVVALVVHAGRELAGHRALQFVVAHEPELLLPHVAFEPGSRFLVAVGSVLAPALARFVPPDRASRGAEWIARVTLAYLAHDRSPLDLTDAAQAGELVRDFVLPGLLARAPQIARARG